MPRPKRFYQDGLVYHVINRGNKRARIFLEPADYGDFLDAMAAAADRVPMRINTFCLMSNHVHIVLWPHGGRDLSAYMQTLMNRHIRAYQRRHHTTGTGHIYQGRFRSFPIERPDHFLMVCRYVEANPVRAGLVDRAEDWPWSGVSCTASRDGMPLLSPWPVDRPEDWLDLVNRQLDERSLDRIRKAIKRNEQKQLLPTNDAIAETTTGRLLVVPN